MSKSKIEWTESTWNPVTGCNKISEGCDNCYAERMAKRLKAMGQQNYINGFEVVCHPHMLDVPLKWKKSNMVFVNSMGDVFHEKVPLDFIKQVFGVMNIADQHFYQVLTKRAKRLLELSEMIKWDSHIWMGVTVENKTFKYRIDYLRKTPAKTKFLSLEPLLGSLGELNLSGIDWVIVGGESGPRARSIEADWAREVRDQCIEQNIPFFFKQWGGVQKKKNGRVLDGVTWDEMPTRELTAV
jgi:protein gp37